MGLYTIYMYSKADCWIEVIVRCYTHDTTSRKQTVNPPSVTIGWLPKLYQNFFIIQLLYYIGLGLQSGNKFQYPQSESNFDHPKRLIISDSKAFCIRFFFDNNPAVEQISQQAKWQTRSETFIYHSPSLYTHQRWLE